MAINKILKDRYEKCNFRILAFCLIAIVVILTLLFILYNPWEKNDTIRIILISFLSTLESIIIGFSLWEIFAKRTFAKEVIDLVHISDNLIESGILSIYDSFANTNFHELISACKKSIIIAFTYGRTWRESNREVLTAFVARGGKLLVYLPDFSNVELMHLLDARFKYSAGNTQKLILESAKAFCNLGASVFLYDGIFQTSYYILDDNALLSVYNHSKSKGYVPAFLINNCGTLNEFIKSEFDSISTNSKAFDPKVHNMEDKKIEG